eukprot:INCI19174.1.p1 GENE.INCI19174.1~~INCI19174.1.p1  ORF type:complete len:1019 (+),score=118.88 INCI19174.1:330-3059(+)
MPAVKLSYEFRELPFAFPHTKEQLEGQNSTEIGDIVSISVVSHAACGADSEQRKGLAEASSSFRAATASNSVKPAADSTDSRTRRRSRDKFLRSANIKVANFLPTPQQQQHKPLQQHSPRTSPTETSKRDKHALTIVVCCALRVDEDAKAGIGRGSPDDRSVASRESTKILEEPDHISSPVVTNAITSTGRLIPTTTSAKDEFRNRSRAGQGGGARATQNPAGSQHADLGKEAATQARGQSDNYPTSKSQPQQLGTILLYSTQYTPERMGAASHMAVHADKNAAIPERLASATDEFFLAPCQLKHLERLTFVPCQSVPCPAFLALASDWKTLSLRSKRSRAPRSDGVAHSTSSSSGTSGSSSSDDSSASDSDGSDDSSVSGSSESGNSGSSSEEVGVRPASVHTEPQVDYLETISSLVQDGASTIVTAATDAIEDGGAFMVCGNDGVVHCYRFKHGRSAAISGIHSSNEFYNRAGNGPELLSGVSSGALDITAVREAFLQMKPGCTEVPNNLIEATLPPGKYDFPMSLSFVAERHLGTNPCPEGNRDKAENSPKMALTATAVVGFRTGDLEVHHLSLLGHRSRNSQDVLPSIRSGANSWPTSTTSAFSASMAPSSKPVNSAPNATKTVVFQHQSHHVYPCLLDGPVVGTHVGPAATSDSLLGFEKHQAPVVRTSSVAAVSALGSLVSCRGALAGSAFNLCKSTEFQSESDWQSASDSHARSGTDNSPVLFLAVDPTDVVRCHSGVPANGPGPGEVVSCILRHSLVLQDSESDTGNVKLVQLLFIGTVHGRLYVLPDGLCEHASTSEGESKDHPYVGTRYSSHQVICSMTFSDQILGLHSADFVGHGNLPELVVCTTRGVYVTRPPTAAVIEQRLRKIERTSALIARISQLKNQLSKEAPTPQESAAEAT